MNRRNRQLLLVPGILALGACSDFTSPLERATPSGVTLAANAAPADQQLAAVAAMVERTNADLAAKGLPMRLSEVWMYTIGWGVDPYRMLRTGLRWDPQDGDVSYMISSSPARMEQDGLTVEQASAAMARGYESWGAIDNAGITPVRVADAGGNIDILDGTFHPVTGACLTPLDITSPRFAVVGGQLVFNPAADIVVGGFLAERYFDKCWENDANETSAIIAVTLLIDYVAAPVDANGDNYWDATYVEQYYNDGFKFVTNGSRYLDFLFFPKEEPVMDLESIAVHENGHALGLGHFGAISTHQLTLKPNLEVFSPRAVMNPGYLGGEVRAPLATDQAAFRTLYAQTR